MTSVQKRLIQLAATLPDEADRTAALAGAKAIEHLRDIQTLSTGWDEGEDTASKMTGVTPHVWHPATIPPGDY